LSQGQFSGLSLEELSQYKDVWVYVVVDDGKLTKPSLELIAAGRKIADKIQQRVVAVMIGYQLDNAVKEAFEYGADAVLYADEPWLKSYICLPYTRILVEMVKQYKPYAFLFIADELGRDLSPRVAYRLKTGLATDNIDLEVEDYFFGPTRTTYKNTLAQIRPDFATRIAKIYTPRHRPQIASIRPGNFNPLPRQPGRRGEAIRFTPTPADEDFIIQIIEEEKVPKSPIDLENAQVVISLGLGILRDGEGRPRSPREGYELAEKLATILREKYGLRVEIGATRALIYAELKELEGIVTKDRQVGQTGKTVAPEIYIALGISGAVQHRVGMIRSKNIVAVNLDPKAPIFEIAHYAVKDDLYKILPKIIEYLSGGE